MATPTAEATTGPQASPLETLPITLLIEHMEPKSQGDFPNPPTPDLSGFYPSTFHPPSISDTPANLFKHAKKTQTLRIPGQNASIQCTPHHRFVRRTDSDEFLVYTDGACLNNGQANPTAGCAFVFWPIQGQPYPLKYGTMSLRLENEGPKGNFSLQTSNRAGLRAVIAALQCRLWYGEGFKRMVIVTDSEYVIKGATEYVKVWENNGWKTSKKLSVKNRDLWTLLLKQVRFFQGKDMAIVFWRVPRQLIGEADAAAKKAAGEKEVKKFTRYHGTLKTEVEMMWMLEPWLDED